MKRRRRTKPLNTELNITNLIDVMMAILVAYMLTAPLMTKGIKVDLPKTEATSIDAKELITVSVNAEGQAFIDDKAVPIENIEAELKAKWDGKSGVLFNSDSKVPYGIAMKAVAQVQSAGISKIGFRTEGDQSSPLPQTQQAPH
jgi:biopolymer transport protein TolR